MFLNKWTSQCCSSHHLLIFCNTDSASWALECIGNWLGHAYIIMFFLFIIYGCLGIFSLSAKLSYTLNISCILFLVLNTENLTFFFFTIWKITIISVKHTWQTQKAYLKLKNLQINEKIVKKPVKNCQRTCRFNSEKSKQRWFPNVWENTSYDS